MAEGAGLPDGRYDVFVVDATAEGDVVHLELTILAGDHKGDVVTVAASGIARDEIDLLGLPATLAVINGRPVVTIEG